MTKPDRAGYARRNAGWLIPAFGAILLIGILRQNGFAVLGGGLGVGWVVWSVWSGRSRK
jgi:hypothetical protein